MKKPAYTLAEVLIAVGVIGIIAAVMLPLASKYRPDKNKVLFLKTYDDIVKTTSDLAKNGDIYPLTDGTYSYAKSPLANKAGVTYNGVEIPGGDNKFCAALALGMNVAQNTCTDADAAKRGFVLVNGVDVKVDGFKILVDVDGDKGKNCTYSDSCKKPDQFTLEIAANGAVAITDSAGTFYKHTRANWKMRDIIPYTEEDIAKWNDDDPKELPNYTPPSDGGGKEPVVEPPKSNPGGDNQEQSSGEQSSDGGTGGGTGGTTGGATGDNNNNHKDCSGYYHYNGQWYYEGGRTSYEEMLSEGCSPDGTHDTW